MSKITCKELSLIFPKASKPTLERISCSVRSGKISIFLGISGSGKTTLLKCLAGLFDCPKGAILYDGIAKEELTKLGRIQALGYVSQHYQLFPHMTVYENCIHPQRSVLKKSRKQASEQADHFLGRLGLLHLKERYPSQLSGGQQQRVAIARALGMGSKALLLDEPTSALDPESTEKLKNLLFDLKEEGYTLVIATHDMAFAESVLDDVYFMQEGKLVEAFQNQEIPEGSKTYQFFDHHKEKSS